MNNLFTAGSVGAVHSMVAMLLLHAGMVLRAGVQLPMAAPINQRHRAGRHGGRAQSCSATTPQIALAEQRQLPLLHAHRGGWSLIRRGWRAKLVDAPCSQAALYAHERLHTARCYPCASTVRVGPAVDAVPCAGKGSNMVPAIITYGS